MQLPSDDGMTRSHIVTVIYSLSTISMYVTEPGHAGDGFGL